MKKYRIAAGASAAVLALGLLTACGKQEEAPVVEETPVVQEDTLENVTPEITPEDEVIVEFPLEENVPEADAPVQEQTILVAELTELGEDGSMTILPYAPVDESLVIEDAAIVDFTAFTAGEESQPLELHEDDLFRLVQEGELTEADASALTVGSMLVITTDESGVQNIVIHQPVQEEA